MMQATSAQAAPSSGTTIITPVEFKHYSPRTALDIVENLPNFTMSIGAQSNIGVNGTNVLINGKPIRNKPSSVRGTLNQINAKDVTKIVIEDATKYKLNGLKGYVANIHTNTSKISGNWSWTPRFQDHRPGAIGNVSLNLSGQKDIFEYQIALRNLSRRQGARGLEIVRNKANTITEYRHEEETSDVDIPSINTQVNFETADGKLGSFNLGYKRPHITSKEISRQQSVKGNEKVRISTSERREWNGEVGGDYDFPLGEGRLKLIGSYQSKHRPFSQQLHTLLSDFSYTNATGTNSLNIENEQVARAEYTWSTHTNEDWQFIAQTAYNSLEKHNIRLKQAQDSLALQDIPKTETFDTVAEKKSEFAILHGRPLGPNVTLQSSFGGEFIHISQMGTGQSERDFFHPKGFTALNYRPSRGMSINTRLQRHVRRFNFFNFIASQNLEENSANETNAGILPEKSWLLSVDLKKTIGNLGSTRLRFFGEEVEDIVAQIPIGQTSEAPGNIDNAERFGAEMSGSVKFAQLGINGLRFNYFLAARHSNMVDPVTNETRRIGGEKLSDMNMSLRYDIPNSDWALTGLVQKSRWASNPRISQVQMKAVDTPFTQITIENKDFFGMNAALGIHNLSDQAEILSKTIYPNRRLAALSRSEYRSRTRGTSVSFSLRGSF
ncbi:hypothetical protein [Hirschia litorea]|uniref:TonB-dependent receptor n=1 Tax=Hirschia litorea TaxID=1199156 RepID=A0ABW2IL92_9PROT